MKILKYISVISLVICTFIADFMKILAFISFIFLFSSSSSADFLNQKNPFAWSLQPESFIHTQESLSGVRAVKRWKMKQKVRAKTYSNDLPVMGLYPCKSTSRTTFICDYR